MTIAPLDMLLADFSIAANSISALVVLWLMQKITRDAGFRCNLAVVLLIQRVLMAALALSMFGNAYDVWKHGDVPRLFDVIEQGCFMLVLLLSAVRHARIPALPPWASWKTPAHPGYFPKPATIRRRESAPD